MTTDLQRAHVPLLPEMIESSTNDFLSNRSVYSDIQQLSHIIEHFSTAIPCLTYVLFCSLTAFYTKHTITRLGTGILVLVYSSPIFDLHVHLMKKILQNH